jgi:hypothetical protein
MIISNAILWIKVLVRFVRAQFIYLRREACAAVLLSFCFAGIAHSETAHHRHHVRKVETDFDCAIHTAYGEARNTSREEEAKVINLLINRAHKENMTICRAAHRYFKPRNGSTPGILDAAKNVLEGDKSLVPTAFINATEMRAWHAPQPPPSKFRKLGSVERKTGNGLHGNVFYEAVKEGSP